MTNQSELSEQICFWRGALRLRETLSQVAKNLILTNSVVPDQDALTDVKKSLRHVYFFL